MDEEAEKKWVLERIQIVMDDTMRMLEVEKEEHTKIADGFVQRVFDFRNSLLAGLGFLASVILAAAAINLLSTFVIESVVIIGSIGFAAFYTINTINVKVAQTLNRAWFAYYTSVKVVYGVKRFVMTKSMNLDALSTQDCATMWIVTNLVPGICGNVLLEAYRGLAQSFLLNQLETHFQFKATQAKGDFDDGYKAYLQVKNVLADQKGLFPDEIMKIMDLYEKRSVEEATPDGHQHLFER